MWFSASQGRRLAPPVVQGRWSVIETGASRTYPSSLDTNRHNGTPRRPRSVAQALRARRSSRASTRRRSACSRCGSRSAARSASTRSGRRCCVIFEGWDATRQGRRDQAARRAASTRATCASSSSRRRRYDEKRHHWLWRFWPALPGWGGMAVLDRSWYGRVLVERVEKLRHQGAVAARLRRDQRLRAHARVRGHDPDQVLASTSPTRSSSSASRRARATR